MSEFTLFTALNSIKRHLLVTVVIFIATYWLLPGSDILEDQYTMDKIIQVGKFEQGHPIDLLSYEEIHAIVTSVNTAVFVGNNLENGEKAQFKITKTPIEKN